MLCAMNNSISPSATDKNGVPTANYGLSSQTAIYNNQPPPLVVSQKRGRGDDSRPSIPVYTTYCAPVPVQPTEEAPPPTPSSTPKKSRSNTYRAAREVKPSILTAMGSLAGVSQAGSRLGLSVPLRRQLSGGNLEEYLGAHDNMDMDVTDSRPRSMSF
jgi:hypothetical protein